MRRHARQPGIGTVNVEQVPSRLRRPPFSAACALAILVGSVGTVGVLTAADDSTDDVGVIEGMEDILTANDGLAENYLLVGSDTRANVEGSGLNEAATGNASEVTGQRSDTIMVLRREQNGAAYLLSLPRDLWVDIPGHDSSRINAAYAQGGAPLLAQTVTQELGIPIMHYVEVDFVGFTKIVDAIGGVRVCVYFEVRDRNSGLSIPPGCTNLDGQMALAYARSRYYEEFRDGDWREDPSADLGRIARQQNLILGAADAVLDKLRSNPMLAGDLIRRVVPALTVDGGTDPVEAAQALRAAATEGMHSVQLPVEAATRNGNAVLELGNGADAVLDFFRGTPGATAPTDPPPTTPPSVSSAADD